MKKERQKLILKIISEEEIGVQEDIQARLLSYGMKVTQATISRDIKELAIIKTIGSKGQYKYSVASHIKDPSKSEEELFLDLFKQAASGIDFAENIVVIKTHAGMAQAVCARLDKTSYNGFIGSIAGDDTIFILMRSGNMAEDFYKMLENVLKLVK